MDTVTIYVTEQRESVTVNVDESALGTNITVTELQGSKGDPGISPLYGAGDPPAVGDLEDGTLYFKYI